MRYGDAGKRGCGEALRGAMRWAIMGLLVGALPALLVIPAFANEKQSDPNKWTATDTALQLTFFTTLAVDRAQTIEFVKHPRSEAQEEVGWARTFVGPHPSAGQVNGYNAACALAHTAIAIVLPKPYRTIWQSVWIGVEVNTIHHNVEVGIGVRF